MGSLGGSHVLRETKERYLSTLVSWEHFLINCVVFILKVCCKHGLLRPLPGSEHPARQHIHEYVSQWSGRASMLYNGLHSAQQSGSPLAKCRNSGSKWYLLCTYRNLHISYRQVKINQTSLSRTPLLLICPITFNRSQIMKPVWLVSM